MDEGESLSNNPGRTAGDYHMIQMDVGESMSNNPGMINEYAALVNAVRGGNWNATRDFLILHPDALTASITAPFDKTILHVAIAAQQERIVQELVNMMLEPDLERTDNNGITALHETTFRGNYKMAECLIRKNRRLVHIRSPGFTELPVVMAMMFGHKELARYLYELTLLQDLEAEQGDQGSELLTYAIYARELDIALDLMDRCPRLAFALKRRGIVTPLGALAVVTNALIPSATSLQGWIYRHYWNYVCLHLGSIDLYIGRTLHETMLAHVQFQKLLYRICKTVATSKITPEIINSSVAPAIFGAISKGNFEFVFQIVKANPDLLWIQNEFGMGIFQFAVQCRQAEIFSLIYQLKENNALIRFIDAAGNNILHVAGMLTEFTPINHITGSVLQMQREVQWFKEVESICPPMCQELLNNDCLTAKELFTRTHQDLREKGEKWMKNTITSGSVVGTLIVTIMFAAAFTIPGGTNQETGSTILVHDKLFKIFMIADSISLFSSSTAVLIFLGIFTSRYAEEDFLILLPKKMVIGFSTLFFSIISMMIAFSAALLITLREESLIVIPIIGLASVPVLFVLMPFRLLVDIFRSTYGRGIFNRKMKPWF
ncbi:hypothetical protein I3843_10G111900 [Carya illinoinensis]|nr:hypothetical protein I3843_10G111900 [Carya illinoinensis]